VGFQNVAHLRGPAVSGALGRSGTITVVSLRLLYLIFRQVLGLVLLLGRTSSSEGGGGARAAS
jgi:hypothetical protein